MAKEIPWKTLSEAYAFIGNSLVKPMTMTSTVGLDPAFWEAFPSFDDEAVAEAVAAWRALCRRSRPARGSRRRRASARGRRIHEAVRGPAVARGWLHGRRCTAAKT